MRLDGRCETDKTRYESGYDHQLLHAMLLHTGRRRGHGAKCGFKLRRCLRL